MRNKIISTKNFVSRHRVGLAVLSTVIICGFGMREATRSFDEFLKENDLYDDYYIPEN